MYDSRFCLYKSYFPYSEDARLLVNARTMTKTFNMYRIYSNLKKNVKIVTPSEFDQGEITIFLQYVYH